MVSYRSKGKGNARRVIPISDNRTSGPNLSRSSDGHKKEHWSAREYLMNQFGKEAFHPDGTIKLSYLDLAIYEAERDHRLTLLRHLKRTENLIGNKKRKKADRLDREDEKKRKEGKAPGGRAATAEERKWLEDHNFKESTRKPGLYYKNQGVFMMMVDLRDGRRRVYAEGKQKNSLPEEKRLEAARKFARDHPELKLEAINKDEVRRQRKGETFVKAHESHSEDGKVEHVEGHEMRLPSYDGGASTKLSREDRDKLPASAFAEPGRRAYPIPSAEQLQKSLGWSREKAKKGAERHAINALARVEQHGTPKEKEEVRRKINQNVPEVKGATAVQGFIPTKEGKVYVEKHEQPRYYVPPHESHSEDGKVEHVEGHFVDAHEVSGYEESFYFHQ